MAGNSRRDKDCREPKKKWLLGRVLENKGRCVAGGLPGMRLETEGLQENRGSWLELRMGLRRSVQNLGRWGGYLYSLSPRVLLGLE